MKVPSLAIRGGRQQWLWPLVKQLVPLTIGFLCLWLLVRRMGDMDIAHIALILKQVTATQWLAAAGATALSFWAVGRYDAVVHRHWRTGYASHSAAYTGATSIALAQTLGLGVFTGALARWRMMPQLGLTMATKISATVAVSFLGGWAVITALANLFLSGPQIPSVMIATPLVLFIALVSTAFFRPEFNFHHWRITLPTLPAIGAITCLP